MLKIYGCFLFLIWFGDWFDEVGFRVFSEVEEIVEMLKLIVDVIFDYGIVFEKVGVKISKVSDFDKLQMYVIYLVKLI